MTPAKTKLNAASSMPDSFATKYSAAGKPAGMAVRSAGACTGDAQRPVIEGVEQIEREAESRSCYGPVSRFRYEALSYVRGFELIK